MKHNGRTEAQLRFDALEKEARQRQLYARLRFWAKALIVAALVGGITFATFVLTGAIDISLAASLASEIVVGVTALASLAVWIGMKIYFRGFDKDTSLKVDHFDGESFSDQVDANHKDMTEFQLTIESGFRKYSGLAIVALSVISLTTLTILGGLGILSALPLIVPMVAALGGLLIGAEMAVKGTDYTGTEVQRVDQEGNNQRTWGEWFKTKQAHGWSLVASGAVILSTLVSLSLIHHGIGIAALSAASLAGPALLIGVPLLCTALILRGLFLSFEHEEKPTCFNSGAAAQAKLGVAEHSAAAAQVTGLGATATSAQITGLGVAATSASASAPAPAPAPVELEGKKRPGIFGSAAGHRNAAPAAAPAAYVDAAAALGAVSSVPGR